MASKRAEKRTEEVRYYIVCVIDLLGQKEKLRGWATLPQGRQPTPAFLDSMRNSVGVVLQFYEIFLDQFQLYAAQRLPDQIKGLATNTQRDLLLRQQDFALQFTQFSDTFAFYVPMSNSQGDPLIKPVYAVLGACCIAMLVSLADYVPLRGGICIGTGIKLPQLSFYGPGLAEAHRLESTVAQYPRIVVAADTVRFLRSAPPPTHDCLFDGWQADMRRVCLEMIHEDSDGVSMVDFLGNAFRRIQGDSTSAVQFVNDAYQFVCAEAAKFATLAKSSETEAIRLASRYERLERYFVTRLPIWGLVPRHAGT